MASDTPLINILTYKLPFELSNQIFNEYQSRLREAKFLIQTYKKYKPLKDDVKVIELFLSLSIFYKRVIANFEGVVKFYVTVNKRSKANTIQIGNYNLTLDEKNKILSVINNYNSILEQFSIPPVTMEYYETRDFLQNLIILKSKLKNGNFEQKQPGNRENQSNTEEELPF